MFIGCAVRLLAADTPTLRALHILGWNVSPCQLQTVIQALMRNTHISMLECRIDGDCRVVLRRTCPPLHLRHELGAPPLWVWPVCTVGDNDDHIYDSDEEDDDETEWPGACWTWPDTWPAGSTPRRRYRAVRTMVTTELNGPWPPWDGQHAWQVAHRRWMELAAA